MFVRLGQWPWNRGTTIERKPNQRDHRTQNFALGDLLNAGLSVAKMDGNFANGQAVASELSRAVEEKGISIVCDAFDKSRGNALQADCSQ
jgi:hypothetical protein